MPYTGVRLPRPRTWVGAVVACVAALVIVPGLRAGPSPDTHCPPPLPADLLISPEDSVQSEALSHFAWGLFLHLQDEAAALRAGGGRRPGSAPTLQFNTGEPAFPPVPEAPPAVTPPVPTATGAAATPAALPAYIVHYREALKRAPDNADVLQLFASAMILACDPSALAKELQALLADDPGATNICLLLSELQFREQKRADACKTLEKGIEASEWTDVRLVRQLCDYLVFEKRFDDAEKWLARARHKGPLKNDFTLALATALFYQEKAGPGGEAPADRATRRLTKKAAGFARDALAIAEKSSADDVDFGPEDGLVLLRVFHAGKDYERALQVIQICRSLFPQADGEFDVWEVESLFKLGRKEDASARLAVLEKRAGMGPVAGSDDELLPPVERRLREVEANRQSHLDNVNLGRLFLEMEKPTEAVAAYERALRIAPADDRLRFILGQLYIAMKQPAKTLEILAPVNAMPQRKHLLLSHAYFALEKMSEAGRELALAEAAARKAEDKAFFDQGFYLYYATVCEESGLGDRAIEKARKALELTPDDPEVLNFLGYVLADHDRELAEALKLIEKAAKVEPQNAAFLDSMGWVLYRLKRFDDALDWIRRAIRYSGDKPDPVILDHAADICAALQMWEEAARYWEQAIAAGDKHPEKIREKLQKMPAPQPSAKSPAPAGK